MRGNKSLQITYTSQQNTDKAYAQRAWKNSTWNAGGRPGEIAKSTKDHLTLDSHFRILRFDWTQIKTAKMKVVFFACHARSYVTCPFNSLFSYFVTNGHRDMRASFLFPDLCDVKQPSSKIGGMFGEFYNDADNELKRMIPADLTGAVRPLSVSMQEDKTLFCVCRVTVSELPTWLRVQKSTASDFRRQRKLVGAQSTHTHTHTYTHTHRWMGPNRNISALRIHAQHPEHTSKSCMVFERVSSCTWMWLLRGHGGSGPAERGACKLRHGARSERREID